MNNGRDCPHGRQVGKCDTCDLIEAEKEIDELKAQVEQKSKVIEHIARAVGEEADPMACWEAVEALKAQVDQLLDAATTVLNARDKDGITTS